MRSYFITGTDTGVGKTVITASLAAILRRRGIDVGVMKPVATGGPGKGRFQSSDVELLHGAAMVSDAEKTINPVFLPVPASPYDAAKALDVKIDMDLVFDSYRTLAKSHQVMLVEGIGGVMTPIKRNFFVADMIKQMGLDTIIVTRSGLGTINHTIMTAELCKKYQIPVRGLIINCLDKAGGLAEQNAPATLHEVTGLPILGTVPFVEGYRDLEEMSEMVEKGLDMNALIS